MFTWFNLLVIRLWLNSLHLSLYQLHLLSHKNRFLTLVRNLFVAKHQHPERYQYNHNVFIILSLPRSLLLLLIVPLSVSLFLLKLFPCKVIKGVLISLNLPADWIDGAYGRQLPPYRSAELYLMTWNSWADSHKTLAQLKKLF